MNQIMHILEKFRYCPICGSEHFEPQNDKSKKCENCGFEYYLNPSAAVAAFIHNAQGELLVVRRKKAPGKGTLDLPGGFADIGETIEEALRREVKEETNLNVTTMSYFASLPNKYTYSGFDVPTLDSFYVCTVDDTSCLATDDDAEEALWLPLEEVHTEEFGMRSIRRALIKYLEMKRNA